MPCYRCAARQDDPVRGASPWQRGVVGGEQVLVCPACQRRPGWAAELDRCAECGSTRLVRALGETRCRACGHVGEAIPAGSAGSAGSAGPAGPARSAGGDPSLAAEVAAAAERMLRGERP